MAIFLVSHGMTMAQFEQLGPDHNLTLPTSVIEMFMGVAGRARRRLAEEAAEDHPARREAAARPARRASAAGSISEETARMLEKKIGRKPSRDEVLSYLMYPDVFLKFARDAAELGRCGRAADAAVLLRDGARRRTSPWNWSRARRWSIKFLTVGEPHPDGTRTVFFELNGQPREVTIRDKTLDVKQEAKPKADPKQPGQIGAPIPGVVSTIAVQLEPAR